MAPLGFEPTITVGERPLSYALDRAAPGTGRHCTTKLKLRRWGDLRWQNVQTSFVKIGQLARKL
jgi:hypothetical protein